MANPDISVFVTSYNQRDYLTEAIDSVLNQTLRPNQIVIADDASTDGSPDLILDYARRHPGLIEPLLQPNNVGIPRNKRAAMERMRGAFVTYLDGDDRFLPEKLEREYEALQRQPDCRIAYSNFAFINAEGMPTGTWMPSDFDPPCGDVFRAVSSRAFPKFTVFRNELIQAECLKSVGSYNTRCEIYEDWELRLRLTHRYRVAHVPQVLTEYRRHEANVSRCNAGLHRRMIRLICRLNRDLLQTLSPEDQALVRRQLELFLSHVSRHAAKEAAEHSRRFDGLHEYVRSIQGGRIGHDWSLLAKLALPECLHRWWSHRRAPSTARGLS
jgi:glycosyltransferase involved in cell wall biosynthesis